MAERYLTVSFLLYFWGVVGLNDACCVRRKLKGGIRAHLFCNFTREPDFMYNSFHLNEEVALGIIEI